MALCILININLKISHGDCIGIIGDSGCGKSTLLDIIMGLLKPSSGEFYVDGTELDKHRLQSWQSNIGHVPQSIFLTNESIEKNGRYVNRFNGVQLRKKA